MEELGGGSAMGGLMVIFWNNTLLFMDVVWYYILSTNPKLGAN